MNKYKIFLDFDGTVVEHDHPRIGREVPFAIETIINLIRAKHEVILNTYRANSKDSDLGMQQAIQFLTYRLSKYGEKMIKCTDMKIMPQKWDWDLIKINNVIFIDDMADNMPTLPGIRIPNLFMVDWERVQQQFQFNGLY